jgi:hypothetical protein
MYYGREQLMAGDIATLSLDGSIDLATFSSALESFRMLLDGLADIFATGYRIDWEITELRDGSAVTAVRGIADSLEAVLSVTTALDAVGEAVEHQRTIPYGGNVETAVLQLTRLVDGRVRAVRIATAEREYMLSSSPATGPPPRPTIDYAEKYPRQLVAAVHSVEALGAVEGTIRTLSDRGSLRFSLYDQFDNRVTCYLEEGQQNEVAALWGRRVIVEGWVQRDGSTGRPLSIRRITAITPVTEQGPHSWDSARGSVPRGPEASRAEDVIRRLRDA